MPCIPVGAVREIGKGGVTEVGHNAVGCIRGQVLQKFVG